MKLLGNVVLSGNIECQTGLHIGQEGSLEIGGIDTPVIKDPVSGRPYVPGSSIKGKMRSLLEWDQGVVDASGDPHFHSGSEAAECPVCRVFGVPAEAETKIGPTRLTVRDAHPTDETIEMWETMDTQMPYTEIKEENYIDRVTSEANPRDIERVPKGSAFDYELVYSVYDLGDGGTTDLEMLSTVERGLALLEDSSLGGSGSRGYGQVQFMTTGDKYVVRTSDQYITEGKGEAGTPADSRTEVSELLGVS
jgi:CRISPR-associated protein Csm3